jgi:2-phosphosulfolactate phosphatase
MQVDVVLLPEHLIRGELADRAVAVFDVLRATTTMAAALAAGVGEIRVFGSIDDARAAAAAHAGQKVLCGEVRCLPPPGFDLGNSPGAFNQAAHASRTVFMSTTNGTKAIVAARGPVEATLGPPLVIGALVNASATAEVLAAQERDVTLLCAGTGGAIAMEDVIGAGAVLEAILARRGDASCGNDVARMALELFRSTRERLAKALRDAQGGRNVVAVGLEADIGFAARLDAVTVVGVVEQGPLRVVRGES